MVGQGCGSDDPEGGLNDGLIEVARHQIARALLRFEPRVLPDEISVHAREGELLLIVRYFEGETPAAQTTVIPIA